MPITLPTEKKNVAVTKQEHTAPKTIPPLWFARGKHGTVQKEAMGVKNVLKQHDAIHGPTQSPL